MKADGLSAALITAGVLLIAVGVWLLLRFRSSFTGIGIIGGASTPTFIFFLTRCGGWKILLCLIAGAVSAAAGIFRSTINGKGR